MDIKQLNRKQLDDAQTLILDVFNKYEATNYPEGGKKAFEDAIHSKEYLDSLTAYGAFDNNQIVGIIASRSEGTHVALFFVDGRYHRQGIGRKLWQFLLKSCNSDIITVNSSLYAVEVYKKLGFIPMGDVQKDNGIQFVPMAFPHFMDTLLDKNNNTAYAKLNEMVAESAISNRYYDFLEQFASLLSHEKSLVRTRGFLLLCSQARWDKLNKLEAILPQMIPVMNDEKGTTARPCLAAIKDLISFKPDLGPTIKTGLEGYDLSKYSDSMAPLIWKDVQAVIDLIMSSPVV